MDEAITKYYRKLLNIRFEHFGSLVNPSIFLDSTGEMIYFCGTGNDFMQLYINVINNTITDIRYSCFCNPTANVAVEILCVLLKGKNLDEATGLSERAFCRLLGTEDPEFQKKAKGLLELLNRGINRYRLNLSK
jgi:NifU-like protein involved in Fe-S cluster formation